MSWNRAPVAAALVAMLSAATEGAVSVFDRPPGTLNSPAIVVARVTEPTSYNTPAFGIDQVTLPVVCVGPIDGDEYVDQLKTVVRQAVAADPMLQLSVQSATVTGERNWRQIVVGGVDLLTVEVVLSIRM